MKKISTGQPSTLETYLGIAKFFGPEAEFYIIKRIHESKEGPKEEVLADERQMLVLLAGIEGKKVRRHHEIYK